MKATPVAFMGRENLPTWLAMPSLPGSSGPGGGIEIPGEGDPEGPAGIVLAHLRKRGASFWREILWETGLSAAEVRDGIAELVSLGWITSDGFRGLRALLQGGASDPSHAGFERSGRWSLLRQSPATGARNPSDPDSSTGPAQASLETIARVLLRRYGVVFRKLADRESLMPPWRDLVRAFRILEARGEIRGGRFVEGYYGEQFAFPEAVGLLRSIRKRPSGSLICISASDPANLQGILTPGPRIPATRGNRLLFRDGDPVAALEGGEMKILASNAGELSPSHNASDPAVWESALRKGARAVGADRRPSGEPPPEKAFARA